MRRRNPKDTHSRPLRAGPIALAGSVLVAQLLGASLVAVAAPSRVTKPQPTSAAPRTAKQLITVDAAVSHVDYPSNTAVFENIVVSQGGTRITADRARTAGLSFKDSRWTFTGSVVITVQPRGTLRADEAVVRIRDDRVTSATVTGHPVHFEQTARDSRGKIHGYAAQMVYDADDDVVRMSGNAQLLEGHNQIKGPLLVYDIRHERLEAVSPGGKRHVHITVVRPAPKR